MSEAVFFSEYGFQSFPEFESIKRYAPLSEDWNLTSEVMMSHQRGGTAANKRINDFLLSEYRQPKDFCSFTYMSQLLQADAMKNGYGGTSEGYALLYGIVGMAA